MLTDMSNITCYQYVKCNLKINGINIDSDVAKSHQTKDGTVSIKIRRKGLLA